MSNNRQFTIFCRFVCDFIGVTAFKINPSQHNYYVTVDFAIQSCNIIFPIIRPVRTVAAGTFGAS